MGISWIKVEVTTPDKPEVFKMADSLGIDPDEVLGKLIRVWAWADMQTADGNAIGVTRSLLDRLTNAKGFTDAMIAVGWIVDNDGELTFPNFGKHNGQSSKKRALTAERQDKFRKNQGGKSDANGVTPALPDKIRSDNKKNNKQVAPKIAPAVKDYVPDNLNHDAWDLWISYRRQTKKAALKPVALGEGRQMKLLVELAGGDHETQMQIVNQSVNQGWQGFFALKNVAKGRDALASGRDAYQRNQGWADADQWDDGVL